MTSYESIHDPWVFDYEHMIKLINYERWICEDSHALGEIDVHDLMMFWE